MRVALALLALVALAAAPAAQRPNQGRLRPGDMAPDFTLELREGGDTVTLSSFRGVRPVALVFGSFT